MNVHPLLHEMKEKPVVIIHRKNKVIAKVREAILFRVRISEKLIVYLIFIVGLDRSR